MSRKYFSYFVLHKNYFPALLTATISMINIGSKTMRTTNSTPGWIGALHWLDQLPRAMRDTRMSLMLLCMRYQFIAYLVLVLSHSLEGHKCVYRQQLTRRAHQVRIRLKLSANCFPGCRYIAPSLDPNRIPCWPNFKLRLHNPRFLEATQLHA